MERFIKNLHSEQEFEVVYDYERMEIIDIILYAFKSNGKAFQIDYCGGGYETIYSKSGLLSKRHLILKPNSSFRTNQIVSSWKKTFDFVAEIIEEEYKDYYTKKYRFDKLRITVDEKQSSEIVSHFDKIVSIKGEEFCANLLRNHSDILLSLVESMKFEIKQSCYQPDIELMASFLLIDMEKVYYFTSDRFFYECNAFWANLNYNYNYDKNYFYECNNGAMRRKEFSEFNMASLPNIEAIFGMGLAITKKLEEKYTDRKLKFYSYFIDGKLLIKVVTLSMKNIKTETVLNEW